MRIKWKELLHPLLRLIIKLKALKAEWNWRDIHMDQWDTTQNPETDPHKSLTDSHKGAGVTYRKDSFFNKWCYSNWDTYKK